MLCVVIWFKNVKTDDGKTWDLYIAERSQLRPRAYKVGSSAYNGRAKSLKSSHLGVIVVKFLCEFIYV